MNIEHNIQIAASLTVSQAAQVKNPAAVALGRLGGLVGGRAKTKAKITAAKSNGRKGGRPKGSKSHKPASYQTAV